MQSMERRAVLIRDAEVDGARRDVRLEHGRVTAVAPALAPRPDDVVIDGHGNGLVPGLHDHHVHLLAMAPAAASVGVGPPQVTGPDAFAAALRLADARLPAGEWIRAVGYHESVAGPLDRAGLDAVVPARPVRVQHRSGALWVLNSAAARQVGLDDDPTGRLFGQDDRLRAGLPPIDLDLSAVGTRLVGCGVTGVTDATPTTDPGALTILATAIDRGDLPQRVVVTGGPALDPAASPELPRGPVKLIVADHDLPTIDDVIDAVTVAHRRDRTIAIHCVTREALVLAIAAFDAAGPRPGDRIEHAAVVPPDMAVRLAELGLTVVTQPNFIRERGDQYLTDVDPDDLDHLYPCGGLIAAGVPVGGGTDAPFGDPDPWRAIAAAVTRTTERGHVLGRDERIPPRRALDLFLTPPDAPGGAPRRVVPGEPADLCLLVAPTADVLAAPSSDAVALTVRDGVIYD